MDVLILLGSDSDLDVGEEITRTLGKFPIRHEMRVASAHRTPARVRALIRRAEKAGAKAVIAVAGMSAHLAGVAASETLLPVIGVPADGGGLKGIDALYSTVNMPGGVPVATMSLGKAGGRNAALLCARIMALTDRKTAAALKRYRVEMEKAVLEADGRVKKKR